MLERLEFLRNNARRRRRPSRSRRASEVASWRRRALRLPVLAIFALAVLPRVAQAQSGLGERLRVQGGNTHQSQAPTNDEWAGIVPELSYTVLEPLWLLRLSYALAADFHTARPLDVSSRLDLFSSFEVSNRALLLVSANVSDTTISNLLTNTPTSMVPVAALPPTQTQLFTTNANQSMRYELSPLWRLNERASGSYATSIGGGTTTLDNRFAGTALGIERDWKEDSAGLEGSFGYARANTSPFPLQTFFDAALNFRWRHDFDRSLTGSIAPGAAFVWSPDPQTSSALAPLGTARLLYGWGDSTLEANYMTGFLPNQVTAQMVRSDQVTIRAATPLSISRRVVAGVSAGFVRGSVANLSTNLTSPPPPFSDILVDANVAWSPSEPVQLFVRYQFFDQMTDATATGTAIPPVFLNAVIVGVQLVSTPHEFRIPSRLPERVDEGDAPDAHVQTSGE